MADCDKERITQKAYIDSQIKHLENLISTQNATMERTHQRAIEALKEQLAGLNEFRGALKDQAVLMATRAEVERTTLDITRRLSVVENEQSEMRGKGSVRSAIWGALSAAGVSLVIGLVIRLMVP